ncbi:protein transporter Sec31 [Streptomyces sp. t39]|uniref:protein transporter Sec31 n=1 Tax=Streptomyces sp. t39 TaxID=1828156 RepID=UPI0011CE017B|nr:protein transporter Sec31 [Streptomyces sp. t39]TXS35135.1 protein transporter Sec31 [Streptomyces sp. t39]
MRTRATTRTVHEPHTIDGVTEMVEVQRTEETLAPPRDWDHLVRQAVTVGAVVMVTVSVVWSTASIGDLLARVTEPLAAYGAAVAFDAAWIMCMAVEWLHRYDAPRAARARRAGTAALLLAMGAVAVHGHLEGTLVIGIVGALVSALAKGSWAIAMSVHARTLDARTQAWVAARRARIDAQRAMIPIRRDLQRGEALVAAERAALASAEPIRTNPDPDQSAESGSEMDEESGPPATGPMTILDAVRTATDCNMGDPDQVLAYVRQVADANAKPDTVKRYMRLAKVAG